VVWRFYLAGLPDEIERRKVVSVGNVKIHFGGSKQQAGGVDDVCDPLVDRTSRGKESK